MRIGLLGDIHGNYLALRAVLDSARTKKVSRLLLTGDFIGYYFEPAKVLRLLSDWNYVAVRGNHEEMLRAARGDPDKLCAITGKYGSGIEIALSQLNQEEIQYLCDLPHPLKTKVDGVSVLLCHGSPLDVDQYIYPDSDISCLSQFADGEHDLLVLGHTHYPMQRELGKMRIVNPGSVGQPRDRRPGAAWAIFDTTQSSVSFHREEYDVAALFKECSRRHPELPYLARVLNRT